MTKSQKKAFNDRVGFIVSAGMAVIFLLLAAYAHKHFKDKSPPLQVAAEATIDKSMFCSDDDDCKLRMGRGVCVITGTSADLYTQWVREHLVKCDTKCNGSKDPRCDVNCFELALLDRYPLGDFNKQIHADRNKVRRALNEFTIVQEEKPFIKLEVIDGGMIDVIDKLERDGIMIGGITEKCATNSNKCHVTLYYKDPGFSVHRLSGSFVRTACSVGLEARVKKHTDQGVQVEFVPLRLASTGALMNDARHIEGHLVGIADVGQGRILSDGTIVLTAKQRKTAHAQLQLGTLVKVEIIELPEGERLPTVPNTLKS